jgi:hypothetical protein
VPQACEYNKPFGFSFEFKGMRIKKQVCVIVFLLGTVYQASAQTVVEGQFGGANYIGLSIGSGLEIPLSKCRTHVLMPSIGLGMMLPPMFKGTGFLRAGLQYKYRSWGIGAEAGRFIAAFGRQFVDILLYPNISHTVDGKGNMYFRMSIGACLAYSRHYTFGPFGNYLEPGPLRLDEIIPGGSLSIGCRLNRARSK